MCVQDLEKKIPGSLNNRKNRKKLRILDFIETKKYHNSILTIIDTMSFSNFVFRSIDVILLKFHLVFQKL